MKLISVVTPCYNEEENVEDLYLKVRGIFEQFPQYRYEHIFIDNASVDKTPFILRRLAQENKNLKVIFNLRNFGHIRSPYYGLLQANGDAVILLCSDFQDPLEVIPVFVKQWEAGRKVIIGVKNASKESAVIFAIRKFYYYLIKKVSDVKQIGNFTGFGLYDRSFLEILKKLNEPYPYFRGLVAEFGFDQVEIPFVQPKRKKGKSHNNFFTLYDMAMQGFVNYSMVPLRMASFIGLIASVISFLVGIVYLIYKLMYWDRFQVGMAPVVIGFFFFSSIQLFFIGMIGEYLGVVLTHVKARPLVIEKERINF